jgi:hypothetical protein
MPFRAQMTNIVFFISKDLPPFFGKKLHVHFGTRLRYSE